MLPANVSAFIEQPFSEQMSLLHWILFIIVIASVAYLWNDVMRIIVSE